MKKRYNTKRRGSVLPLVLIAVILLLLMGTSLLSMGLSNRIYSLRDTSEVVSRCAADAGITKALFEMNKNLETKMLHCCMLPCCMCMTNLSNCDADYCYMVTGTLAGGYKITSVGDCKNVRRMITASIELQGLFNDAILTKEDLILKSGTIVDAYDSSDPTATDIPVIIGTQDTKSDSIVLNIFPQCVSN